MTADSFWIAKADSLESFATAAPLQMRLCCPDRQRTITRSGKTIHNLSRHLLFKPTCGSVTLCARGLPAPKCSEETPQPNEIYIFWTVSVHVAHVVHTSEVSVSAAHKASLWDCSNEGERELGNKESYQTPRVDAYYSRVNTGEPFEVARNNSAANKPEMKAEMNAAAAEEESFRAQKTVQSGLNKLFTRLPVMAVEQTRSAQTGRSTWSG